MRTLKKITLIGASLLVISSTACTSSPKEEFVPEEITFERISSVKKGGYFLEPGEERTIDVFHNILDCNYLKLVIQTDVNIYGTFNYSNIDDPSEKVSESFFVEQGEEEQDFCQFLDAYRPEYNNHENCNTSSGAHAYYDIPAQTKMARGLFSKKLETITIKNVSKEEGTAVIGGLYYSDRDVPMEEVYLTRGFLKVGTDFMGGGTLTYLERLNYQTTKATYNIDEVLTPTGDVYVGVNATRLISDPIADLGSKDHHVNLINYYDSGRQFQQSFYANIGGSEGATAGENGYTRKWCYTGSRNGRFWPYNPVQGGDCHVNISQIVDYNISEDTIYVKCKPLDWADNNYVTDSYMENWYSIKNNCVFVKNRFTNFACFTDMELCNRVQLELPAAYIIHPFSTYVTYQGNTPWIDDQLGLVYKSDLGPWAERADIVDNHPEDWFAWLNSDGFGVGVYIPDVSFYASGRSNATTNFSFSGNADAFSSPMGDPNRLKYNKKETTYSYQSCYTRNTSYTAPEILTIMLDFIPFEYSYALSVDYLPIIRNNFKNIYKRKEIDNSSLFVWDEEIRRYL